MINYNFTLAFINFAFAIYFANNNSPTMSIVSLSVGVLCTVAFATTKTIETE